MLRTAVVTAITLPVLAALVACGGDDDIGPGSKQDQPQVSELSLDVSTRDLCSLLTPEEIVSVGLPATAIPEARKPEDIKDRGCFWRDPDDKDKVGFHDGESVELTAKYLPWTSMDRWAEQEVEIAGQTMYTRKSAWGCMVRMTINSRDAEFNVLEIHAEDPDAYRGGDAALKPLCERASDAAELVAGKLS